MKVLIAMLSLVTLLDAYPALAQWSHGGPSFAGPGPGGPPAGRLLERLIDPCRAACFDAAHGCRDSADADTLNDVQPKCQSQISTAKSVCATNHVSHDCQEAKGALYICAQPSLTALRSAVRVCRNAAETCVDACNSVQ